MTRQNSTRAAAPPKALLLQAARLTIEAAACWRLPPCLELSLLLTDDEGIRALNRAYRGQDKPTDVLSFPLWEEQPPISPGSAALPLGDIVISLARAEAMARELGHSARRETAFLFVHGLLHLLGYDHEQGAAAKRRMFAQQKQIITQLEAGGPL
jgi:probable rRNA maturation factor